MGSIRTRTESLVLSAHIYPFTFTGVCYFHLRLKFEIACSRVCHHRLNASFFLTLYTADSPVTSPETLSARYETMANDVVRLATGLLSAAVVAGAVMLTVHIFESLFFFVAYSLRRPMAANLENCDVVVDGSVGQQMDNDVCCRDDGTAANSASATSIRSNDRKQFLVTSLADDDSGNQKDNEFRRIYIQAVGEPEAGRRDVILLDFNSGFAETNV